MENKITKVLGLRSLIIKFQIRKVTIRFSKMRAKEERKQREELEATLKLLKKKTFHCRKSLNGKFK